MRPQNQARRKTRAGQETGHKMGIIRTVESVLAANRTLAIGVQNCPSEECEPVTLQVVLLGGDGIVIASDTCAANINSRYSFRTTDHVSKIVIESKLAYTFAGDECAKEVGAAVARAVGEPPQPLTAELIEEVSNRTLEEWRNSCGNDRVDYRKDIWVQATDVGFTIWSAVCDDRAGKFVVKSHEVALDGKSRVFAGDEFNQARYIVEHYYDKYPLRKISSLKRLAAHAILTGSIFNSAGVSGLEMVLGNSNGFAPIPREKIQELAKLSRTIHEENDSRFRDQNSLPEQSELSLDPIP
jgi:hypothetical protein